MAPLRNTEIRKAVVVVVVVIIIIINEEMRQTMTENKERSKLGKWKYKIFRLPARQKKREICGK